MQREVVNDLRSSRVRRRIVQAAIRLYREIGYRKTRVADIARGAFMSPANIYRFFPSMHAIEEAVVAELFEEVSGAAHRAACRGGSAPHRLSAALRAISHQHEVRLANDSKLHELLVAATSEKWPIALSYADGVRDVIRSIIAAGQANSEIRTGSPMALTCCVLEAMDGYVSPSRANATAVRPTFDEMMSFCADALCLVPLDHAADVWPELRPREVGQR